MATEKSSGPPVTVPVNQAVVLLSQFLETARHRGFAPPSFMFVTRSTPC